MSPRPLALLCSLALFTIWIAPAARGEDPVEKPATSPEKKAAPESLSQPPDQAADDSKDAAERKPPRAELRMVIVGPDGQRREINIDRDLPEALEQFLPRSRLQKLSPDSFPALRARLNAVLGESMIGVDCRPAPPALRAQLRLGEVGLVIASVLDGSPAADAGLQQHDVLVKAGDTELREVQHLVDAVQAASGNALTLTFLRDGTEQTVEVTPVARSETRPARPDSDLRLRDLLLRLNAAPGIDLEGLPGGLDVEVTGPGMLLDRQSKREASHLRPRELQEKLDALTKQIEALQKAVEDLHDQQSGAPAAAPR